MLCITRPLSHVTIMDTANGVDDSISRKLMFRLQVLFPQGAAVRGSLHRINEQYSKKQHHTTHFKEEILKSNLGSDGRRAIIFPSL